MTEVTPHDVEGDEDLRMDGYYIGFGKTGVIAIDRILSAIACAGKAYHHTEDWTDETLAYEDVFRGKSPNDWIQCAANDAADLIRALSHAPSPPQQIGNTAMSTAGTRAHSSDCALHNMPAELPGPCDCGEITDPRERSASFLDALTPLNAAQRIDALAKALQPSPPQQDGSGLVDLLKDCRAKLEVFFAQIANGAAHVEYKGGPPYDNLLKRIDAALAPTPKASDHPPARAESVTQPVTMDGNVWVVPLGKAETLVKRIRIADAMTGRKAVTTFADDIVSELRACAITGEAGLVEAFVRAADDVVELAEMHEDNNACTDLWMALQVYSAARANLTSSTPTQTEEEA